MKCFTFKNISYLCIMSIELHMVCCRVNLSSFGRTFVRLSYIDITKNTYIKHKELTEKMVRVVLKNESCYTFIDYQIHIKTVRNL